MEEAELRAVMLNAEDELAFVCAEVLAVLELRDQGQELLQFNLVDVTVDCDERRVTVETCLAIEDLPVVSMSADRFVEVATPLAELRSQEDRDQWKLEKQERLRGRPMPGPASRATE